MLGRRGRIDPAVAAMNVKLNTLIQLGIKNGFFPKSFQSIMGNGITSYVWRSAYDQTEDFEFITLEEYQAENNPFRIGREQLYQVSANNPTVWQKPEFQEFMNLVMFSQLTFTGPVPELTYAFLKVFETMIRERIEMSEETQKELIKVTRMSLNGVSLQGGKIADPNPKSATWVKPVVVTAIVGTVLGIGYWKKDEIMEAVNGKKSKAVNGLNGAKKKKTTRKGLGNVGMQKIKAIQKRAKKLQHESGYAMKNVKEIHFTTEKRSRPKLKWQDAMKRAANELR